MTFEDYTRQQLLVEMASTEWLIRRSLLKRDLLGDIDSQSALLSAVAADTSIGAADGARAAAQLWADYQARWA